MHSLIRARNRSLTGQSSDQDACLNVATTADEACSVPSDNPNRSHCVEVSLRPGLASRCRCSQRPSRPKFSVGILRACHRSTPRPKIARSIAAAVSHCRRWWALSPPVRCIDSAAPNSDPRRAFERSKRARRWWELCGHVTRRVVERPKPSSLRRGVLPPPSRQKRTMTLVCRQFRQY